MILKNRQRTFISYLFMILKRLGRLLQNITICEKNTISSKESEFNKNDINVYIKIKSAYKTSAKIVHISDHIKDTRSRFYERPESRTKRKTHYHQDFSRYCRVPNFGDLRTRKECHPVSSRQLLSHASS